MSVRPDEKIQYFKVKSQCKHAPIPLLQSSTDDQNLHSVGSMYSIKINNQRSLTMIKSILTLKTKAYGSCTASASYKLYEETDNFLLIPRVFGLLQYGCPLLDNRTAPHGENVAKWHTNLVLSEWQDDAMRHVINCLLEPPLHSAVLSAACGMGKTCMAIYLMCQLGLKSVVLVHKEFLLTQWVSRITQFCPDLNIGRVQGDIFNIGDVTLVMIQSICNGKYDSSLFDSVELVIVDECHHLCASTFHKSMRLFKARYTLGLSATLKRGDGNERAIFWFLGYPVVSCSRETGCSQQLSVRMVYSTECYVPDVRTTQNTLMFPTMLTRLIAKENRIRLIVDEIVKLNMEQRHILVISERIDLLDNLQITLKQQGIHSVKYVGETSKKKSTS